MFPGGSARKDLHHARYCSFVNTKGKVSLREVVKILPIIVGVFARRTSVLESVSAMRSTEVRDRNCSSRMCEMSLSTTLEILTLYSFAGENIEPSRKPDAVVGKI